MTGQRICRSFSLLCSLGVLPLACDNGDTESDSLQSSGTELFEGTVENGTASGSSEWGTSTSDAGTSSTNEVGSSTVDPTANMTTVSSTTAASSESSAGTDTTVDATSEADSETTQETSEGTEGDDLVPGDRDCVQSELPRTTDPRPSEAARQTYRDAISSLGFKLLAGSANTTGNLAFSALSISTAVGLPLGAAAGDTLARLTEQLGLPHDRSEAAEVLNYVELELESRTGPVEGRGDKEVVLEIANALYVLPGHRPQPDYLDLLAQNWGMGVCGEAFSAHAEESRNSINRWVSEQTRNNIPMLFGPGSIGSLTTQVYVNAVYFAAPWKTAFTEHYTKPEPFHLLDGSTVEVPTMIDQFWGEIRFAEYEGTTIVELPIADRGQLSAIIVVPALGQYKQVESSLDSGTLQAMIAGLAAKSMVLHLPKFTVDSGTLDLFEDLGRLGLDEVAQGRDFSFYGGESGTSLKPVDQFIHRTFIGIDENGVIAAAASGGVSNDSPLPAVRVDRPFLFFIRDQPTGIDLFFGRVLNPL